MLYGYIYITWYSVYCCTVMPHVNRFLFTQFIFVAIINVAASVNNVVVCNASIANKNQKDGKCPIAKCLGDDKYPSTCKRVSRYHLTNDHSPRSSNSTISSNDPPATKICCQRMCHLEYPNGKECLPRGYCDSFQCCADQGNPILESYPPKCCDSKSNKCWTKGKETNSKSSSNALSAVGASLVNCILYCLFALQILLF